MKKLQTITIIILMSVMCKHTLAHYGQTDYGTDTSSSLITEFDAENQTFCANCSNNLREPRHNTSTKWEITNGLTWDTGELWDFFTKKKK